MLGMFEVMSMRAHTHTHLLICGFLTNLREVTQRNCSYQYDTDPILRLFKRYYRE